MSQVNTSQPYLDMRDVSPQHPSQLDEIISSAKPSLIQGYESNQLNQSYVKGASNIDQLQLQFRDNEDLIEKL